MPVIGRNTPLFTPPPLTASTQPCAVNRETDSARPYPPHPAPFRLSADGSIESAERNQRLQSALYCGWHSLKRVEHYSGHHTHYYQADVSLSPGHIGTVMAIFEEAPQGHRLTTLAYAGSDTGFNNETGDVLPEQASRPHPAHPGPFRLFGDDISVTNESNQRLRRALQCGWYSLRQDENRSDDHTHYYQANVSLSPGQAGIVMAVFEKDAQGHQLTTLGYLGSETGFHNETGTVIPEQAPPSAQGELTQYQYAHQSSLTPRRFSREPSIGFSTLTGYDSDLEQTLVAPPPPAAFLPTQRHRVPLERKGSLQQLVDNTITMAQEKKVGKNGKAVKKAFTRGVAALNANTGKPHIDEEAAAAFYATASAGKTRFPRELLAKFNANKQKNVKEKFGPDATVARYERATKDKLAKKRLGPDATAADYGRAIKDQLAQDLLGPNATAIDYDYARAAARAAGESGPTATAVDLGKLQVEKREMAARLRIDVKEIRRKGR